MDNGGLRAAWTALMKRHHPDASGTGLNAREVNAAYEVLRGRTG